MAITNQGLAGVAAEGQMNRARGVHIERAKDPALYNRVANGMSDRQKSWGGHDRIPTLDTRACGLRPRGEG